ncbi:hypothetical protein K504DRAFT_506519 [Pleomassaria siparia CBS 279.74]|uniref:CFEM domain-containing protein n=1 Tax=Pleomassaria siparia CBS 279.74 TaxID=1314801 RepID=A0A6G1JY01_9PLEO|nr:hypothetical protein K504DRAFT_506519 [Pleomassaria siparia CBS 279.74]
MKSFISLLFLVLALITLANAQGSVAGSIVSLPPCALACLFTAVEESPCTLANVTCVCTNVKLQSSVEACALQSCTVKESLTTKNITMTICNVPIRSRVILGRTVNITLGVISAIFVLIRIGYKLLVSRTELGWDDHFIIITLLTGVPNTIIIDIGAFRNGLGLDTWTLPFDEITRFVRFFYIMEVNYFADLSLLKLSLLFFYLRIFPASNVKRVIRATIAFDVTYGITFVIVSIFQCRPISHYWTNWDGEHRGTCININALGWANAAISISLDVWMLAIPLSQLVHLKLAWKKKVGVAMMFFVGTFVTVVSILRLQSLVTFATSHNPTWDQWDVSNWSTIELNVGIVCACMPSMRVILVRLFPKILGSTANSSYRQKYGSRSQELGKNGGLTGRTGTRKMSSTGNSSVINYMKTFAVQHDDYDDEMELVKMGGDVESEGKKKKKKKDFHSSEINL